VKASSSVTIGSSPAAAAELRAIIEVKKPVNGREAAVMTGVPAVTAEIRQQSSRQRRC
jgi:hypothetical protein